MASVKNRIIETDDERFMPEFKPGVFSGWRFYYKHADALFSPYVALMSTKDPDMAASFVTLEDAQAFIVRVAARAEAYWRAKEAEKRRVLYGVNVKRKIGA